MNRFDIKNLKKGAHIHFIGIGGISMSGIAHIMLGEGFEVSGSDRCESSITEELESLGAAVYIGHKAENVHGADLVVHTAAVHDDNPEMQEAKKLGITLIDRAECLGAIMKGYTHRIGISGTHGKTTTTGMLSHALIAADLDPTISIGGELDLIGGNIRVGGREYFVTESCEYTNSFLKFFPTVSVITNVEEDHLDFFKDIDDIKKSFRKFAELSQPNGYIIVCADNKNATDAVSGIDGNIITYGIKSGDYKAENIRHIGKTTVFDCHTPNEIIKDVTLNVVGEHNILNALAVIAVCRVLGADMKKSLDGIKSYEGTHRRFERKGTCCGAEVIDDYAHHPTEIKATLSAAKDICGGGKIRCIFQPHTYSRTRTLWDKFLTAFDDADELILTDIYAAREKPDGVTTSASLAEAISKRKDNVKYIKEFSDIADYIKSSAKPGDMIFTMGAGTVTEIGPMLTDEK